LYSPLIFLGVIVEERKEERT